MPAAQDHGDAAAPTPSEPAAVVRVLMPSPIGPLGVELLGVAVTRLLIDPGDGLKASFIPLHQFDGSEVLDEIFGRLAEYFAGARRRLDIEYDLAPSGLDAFARRVLKETAKIPYGKTRSHSLLADASGRSDAYRLVVSTLLENPIPILIPCHRVITHKSGIGSYIGGAERKRWLLEMEQAACEDPG